MRAGRDDGSHKHEKCKSRKLCAGRCLEAELLKEREAYEEEIERIREELDHEMDDDYIMRIAREKLNYYLPDEIIFYNDR